MAQINNPALREQPREKPAAVIPPRSDSSILDWLESSGRLLARDTAESDYSEAEEEITALMGSDDSSFDLDDDDDALDLDD